MFKVYYLFQSIEECAEMVSLLTSYSYDDSFKFSLLTGDYIGDTLRLGCVLGINIS